MRTLLLLLGFIIVSSSITEAQTLDELKSMKAEKEAVLGALQSEINELNAQIDAIPTGWKYGAIGIIGLNLSGNEGWFANDDPYTTSTGYGINLSAFANADQKKYFWNNNFLLNLQKVITSIQDGPDGDETDIESLTDAVDLSSLFGYKLNDKWAASAQGRFSTAILNFNEPGKLTATAGATWTPIGGLVVNIHPLGYEKNWPGELISMTGAKVGATYNTTLFDKIAWSSNFTSFIPYAGGDVTFENNLTILVKEYEASDLINWTWVNGFSTNIWKGIGLGVNVGLRQDRQFADRFHFDYDGELSDNPVQIYYNMGLSYTL
jgi:hypothetical protein